MGLCFSDKALENAIFGHFFSFSEIEKTDTSSYSNDSHGILHGHSRDSFFFFVFRFPFSSAAYMNEKSILFPSPANSWCRYLFGLRNAIRSTWLGFYARARSESVIFFRSVSLRVAHFASVFCFSLSDTARSGERKRQIFRFNMRTSGGMKKSPLTGWKLQSSNH